MFRIVAKRAIAWRYSRTVAVTIDAAARLVEAAIPARDREARREPLHVPLERARQRLVEVVDAEDQPAVGCGEDAEVGQVRVAAELRVQPVRGPAARSAAIR